VKYLLQHRIAEFLQLDKVDSTLVWLMAGLAPWRGYRHPNPPKKEPKFCSSLITKHELMYGEIRGVVEDVFEYNKMTLVKDAVEGNAVQDILREDAGITYVNDADYSYVDTTIGTELEGYNLHCPALRFDTIFIARSIISYSS
jgi:hypothetical protein